MRALTPNRLTVLSALLALGSAVAFATGRLVVGALVFQASFLVDCMDGKLAALRGGSRWGGFFDVAGDSVRFVACFTALAVATAASAGALSLLPVVLYPCARFALLAMAEARPAGGAERGVLTVAPNPLAVLRLAPRRATKPGTSVDAEAVALTLGPILHATTACFAVAAALHLAHALLLVGASLRSYVGERNATPAGDA